MRLRHNINAVAALYNKRGITIRTNKNSALRNTVKRYDMTSNEVRMVNANQERGMVYFHMVDNKTIVRTMSASEIRKANTIGSRQGEEARKEEYVRLFNEKYSEPQSISNVELSAQEKRYFELHNMSKVFPLDAEQEEELKSLED